MQRFRACAPCLLKIQILPETNIYIRDRDGPGGMERTRTIHTNVCLVRSQRQHEQEDQLGQYVNPALSHEMLPLSILLRNAMLTFPASCGKRTMPYLNACGYQDW
jgi:hypothetical protein